MNCSDVNQYSACTGHCQAHAGKIKERLEKHGKNWRKKQENTRDAPHAAMAAGSAS
jgi:hypothetical protein